MWLALALASALFQVLRNTAMKRLGHALDEYINVWGRFTFLLPFALAAALGLPAAAAAHRRHDRARARGQHRIVRPQR